MSIAKAVKQVRHLFIYAGIFSFFINVLMLAPSIYMMQVFDRVMSSRSNATLFYLSIGVTGALLLMMVLEVLRSRLLVAAAVHIDQRMGPLVAQKVILSAANPQGNTYLGALRDLMVLRSYLTGTGMFALFDAPLLPLLLILIFFFSPVLGWCALAGAVIIIVVGVVTEKLTRKSIDRMTTAMVQNQRFFDNAVRNAEAVTALGMDGAIRKRWAALNHKVLVEQVHSSYVVGTTTSLTRFNRQLLQALMMGVGVLLIIDQHTSPGVMLAASFISARALAPIEQIIGYWGQMIEAKMAYQRLRDYLKGSAEQEEEHEQVELPPPAGEVSSEQLFYALQPSGRLLLRNLNFKIEPGESVGIAGPSGSGKTTLLRLLTGVWPASAGAVRLDGANVAQLPRQWFGQHVGYVPQDVELFAGTIGENISRLGQMDSEAVVRAAQRAGVHDMILRLPNGYETELGDGGSGLSGGQRQRVALARALYGEPRVVILDEPNANLDGEGEQALLRTFRQLKEDGVTLIVVAHKPSLFQDFDKLMIIKDGQLEAFGSRESVVARFTPQAPVQAVPQGVQP